MLPEDCPRPQPSGSGVRLGVKERRGLVVRLQSDDGSPSFILSLKAGVVHTYAESWARSVAGRHRGEVGARSGGRSGG